MSAIQSQLNKDWLPYPWQLDVWQHFYELQLSDRLPHALLLNGERGSGKQMLALGLAKQLLCQQNNEFACGTCKSCQLFQAGSHPDFVNIHLEEKAKQIKVDQIRSVVDFVAKTSQMNGMKVVLIEPAEAMNTNAANALLKCLEEPADKTLLILVSHAINRLLPTIRSRCQNVSMPKPGNIQSETWLSTFINDINQRQRLLHLANDNPLLALTYWENDVLRSYDDCIDKLLALKGRQLSIVKMAEGIQKGDVTLWLDISQKLLWQLIRSDVSKTPLSEVHLELFEDVLQTPNFSRRAYRLLEEIQAAIYEDQGPSNPNLQLMVESLLIRWQALFQQRR